MSKELDIRKECCDIWNNLKDKTKMVDYLIESKKQIADLEHKLSLTEKALELACNELDIYCTPEGNSIKEDFIEIAKEMMKSE